MEAAGVDFTVVRTVPTVSAGISRCGLCHEIDRPGGVPTLLFEIEVEGLVAYVVAHRGCLPPVL